MDDTSANSEFFNEIEQISKKEAISISSFLLLTVIGKGSYAKVVLVKKKDTGEIFALKILKKENIELKNQINHVKTERNILVSSFLVRIVIAYLHYCLLDPFILILLVMDLGAYV
jgi:serine/threonine protein kinase